MTVSLDSPLGTGPSERRQRIRRTLGRAAGFVGKMARNPLTAIGGGIILLLLIVAAFTPLIAPYNPLVQDLNNALVAPNALHWFGTDEFGRDIQPAGVRRAHHALHRAAGLRDRFGPLGLLLGVTAGYFGGRVDAVLMRVTDIFISFPSLVLALAFVAALGPGLEQRGDCDYAHRLAADCPSGARRNSLSAPGRFYLRRAASGCFPGARTVASHRPAVPAVSDYPHHHEHGGDHSHRRRAGLPWPWRTAAWSRSGER